METAHVDRDRDCQDTWVRGATLSHGSRECDMRYKMILRVIMCLIQPGFTMIDFGANAGYFTNRVAYDFPDSRCIAIDVPEEERLVRSIEMNSLPNVYMIQERFAVAGLLDLKSTIRGDLTLVFSVIHHFKDQWQPAMDALRQLSRYTLVEVYPRDTDHGDGSSLYREIYDYMVDGPGVKLKHINPQERPMFVLSNEPFRFPEHLREDVMY